ncbi:hypothetical protein PsorP6_003522 [Peronosclerospora sorghi]|uniref:Uncharacterized protein n=1 Tax=Peronosclerospora sorghi TaxID=230839 RepID=A0ACC0VM65_9STRA|nr:hypothetical protein PsorP6_003522 [Peronosclerospora sorghi]
MTTEKRRQSIEVFRLQLRETVNEGDDVESSSSPKNTPEDGVGQSELVVPLSIPNENGSDEKVEGGKETEHCRPDERDCSRSGMKLVSRTIASGIKWLASLSMVIGTRNIVVNVCS